MYLFQKISFCKIKNSILVPIPSAWQFFKFKYILFSCNEYRCLPTYICFLIWSRPSSFPNWQDLLTPGNTKGMKVRVQHEPFTCLVDATHGSTWVCNKNRTIFLVFWTRFLKHCDSAQLKLENYKKLFSKSWLHTCLGYLLPLAQFFQDNQ